MRAQCSRTPDHGSVLLTTVCIAGVVGVVLVCCLSLVNSQNQAVVRSQVWNACVPIAEAGIEEAMAHLNNRNESSYSVNGWQQYGSDFYRSRNLGESFYQVKLALVDPLRPVIFSTGYVRAPLVLSSGGQPLLASSVEVGGVRYLSRTVKAVAEKRAFFNAAMAAKRHINLNGNSIETDSFNSLDTLQGLYNPATAKDNGDVVAIAGGTNIINVGNANIKGHVRTGAGGTPGLNANGVVGSMAWHLGGNKGVQEGWATDDMNMIFEEVIRPKDAGSSAPVSGVVTGRVYKYLLGGGTHVLSSLNVGVKEKIGVTNHTILIVDGNVDIMGGIEIHPGGSLHLYVAGASAAIGGSGVNNTGRATNFMYFGLPGNTKLSLPFNGDFTGAIYAPNADLMLSGGGSTTLHFTGACVMRNIAVNGIYKFHYDESLAKSGPKQNFVIVSWIEL